MRTRTFYYTLGILLLITSAIGCKKTKNETPAHPTSSTYHISWSYQPVSGVPSYANLYPFAFTSDAPATSTYLWTFGDGATSTMSTPTHTYSALGTYTVTLTVNGEVSNMVTRVLDVYWNLMPHKISYSATWMKDSMVHFRSNVLPDSTFYWQFGDGTTSTDSTPSHAYAAVGTYTVTLTVNGNAATACSTAINIVNVPATAGIGGTRTWHDTLFSYQSNLSGPLAYPRADAVFAINIINPLQVQFEGNTLYYSPASTTDSMLVYNSTDYFDNTGNNHYTTAYYYRYHDSIAVFKYDRISAGGYSIEQWKTP